jgi:hypothetical protein
LDKKNKRENFSHSTLILRELQIPKKLIY